MEREKYFFLSKLHYFFLLYEIDVYVYCLVYGFICEAYSIINYIYKNLLFDKHNCIVCSSRLYIINVTWNYYL